jgi:peptidoglycan/xylan/chitin deacetylase (PgdA/CDA1 family)
MRKVLACILYIMYFLKIRKILNKEGVLLSIYGHDPKGESVEKAFKWLLKHGYEFVTPNELLLFLEGNLDKKKPVWVSFDDGWKSNYYELLPILEKYKIPATIFVATKGVETGYDWINQARENRDSLHYETIDELWTMPNSRRKEIISKLPQYKGERTMMNIQELHAVSNSPYVYLANHTNDHVISDTCTKEELLDEILTCETKIKQITGKPCIKVFAYPNGDYDLQSIEVLEALSYQIAATTELDWVYPTTHPFEIPRFVLPDNASHYENILQIFGLWTPFFDKVKEIINIKNHK